MHLHLSIYCFLFLFATSEANVELPDNDGPLIVTPLIREGNYKEARRRARVNFTQFGIISGYSGYFQVNVTTETNLFFWFLPSENSPSDPLILCLQGGPGVSALLWLFFENGPYSIDGHGTFGYRKHSWSKTNSLLYIDAKEDGFSFRINKTEQGLVQVTVDLLEAVKQFFKMFPHLQNNSLFILGESDGGKYAASLGNRIIDCNQNSEIKINLKGVIIENGHIDPELQTGYTNFFYQLGFLNEDTKVTLQQIEKQKNEYYAKNQWNKAAKTFNNLIQRFSNKTGLDRMFNVFEKSKANFVLEEEVENYLNQKAVQTALHVGSKKFTLFKSATLSEVFESGFHILEELLNKNCSVLLFTGQLGAIMPYISVFNFVKRLKFPGSNQYINAPRRIWKVKGETAGYVKQVGVLTDVIVQHAGHMAAFTKGVWIYDLIEKFTRQQVIWD